MNNYVVEDVESSVSMVENGFKPMEKKALEIKEKFSDEDVFKIAFDLYDSKYYQVRAVAIFLFGFISKNNEQALIFLKDIVSQDENWRIQEILAKSFDFYCKENTYKKSLNTIKEWLNSNNQNVRRAVTEGLRIWTSRPYFKDNPQEAITLLSNLKNDDSEYVRKSVGNALRDISKKHSELVIKEIKKWDRSSPQINQVYKLVIKNKLLDH